MPHEGKDLLRRFYEAVSAGNLDALDELMADEMVEHEPLPGFEPSKQGVKQFFAAYRSAFPDLRMEPHEMLAKGDLVFARVTATGTQHGEFLGIPATGRRIEVGSMHLLRVRDSQAIEHRGIADAMSMMRQLGALPEPS